MSVYYFRNDEDINGRHEVHISECTQGPASNNRTRIGIYSNCKDAIQAAKKKYPSYRFDGCYYCATECHKG